MVQSAPNVPAGYDESQVERLLLVEGTFDLNFFRALLHANHRRRVRIESLGSVSQVRRQILTRSQAPGFRRITWLGVAVDGDTNPDGRFQSVRDVIRLIQSVQFHLPTDSWLTAPTGVTGPRATIFVFPDGKNPGDIETFIRHAVTELPATRCVDLYLECLAQAGVVPSSPSKAWLHAFLASLAEPGETLSAAARSGNLPTDLPGFGALLDLIPRDDEEF